MLLPIAAALIVIAALAIAMRRSCAQRIHPILLAAATTAPVVAALAVFRSGTDLGLLDIFLTLAGALPLAFVACLLAVIVIGVPLSLLLDRLGYVSRLAYILAGVTAALSLTGCVLLYDWCCVASGPFVASIADRVFFSGVQYVVKQYLVLGGSAALCATVAANFYWQGRFAVSPSNPAGRDRG